MIVTQYQQEPTCQEWACLAVTVVVPSSEMWSLAEEIIFPVSNANRIRLNIRLHSYPRWIQLQKSPLTSPPGLFSFINKMRSLDQTSVQRMLVWEPG